MTTGISIPTQEFRGKIVEFECRNVEYASGCIENRSEEPPSRFDVKVGGDRRGAGKIRIEGATVQALEGFSGKKMAGRDDDDEDVVGRLVRPLLAVAFGVWRWRGRRPGDFELVRGIARQYSNIFIILTIKKTNKKVLIINDKI